MTNDKTNYKILKVEKNHKHHINFLIQYYFLILFFGRFYLFLERGKGGRKRSRETSICGCLSCAPYWGPGLQPRHVPWLGIQPASLRFVGRHSVCWATPARATSHNFLNNNLKIVWYINNCLFPTMFELWALWFFIWTTISNHFL